MEYSKEDIKTMTQEILRLKELIEDVDRLTTESKIVAIVNKIVRVHNSFQKLIKTASEYISPLEEISNINKQITKAEKGLEELKSDIPEVEKFKEAIEGYNSIKQTLSAFQDQLANVENKQDDYGELKKDVRNIINQLPYLIARKKKLKTEEIKEEDTKPEDGTDTKFEGY